MNTFRVLIIFLSLFFTTSLSYSAIYIVDDDSDGVGIPADCTIPVADECSLRDAIEAANASDGVADIINFSGVTGTIDMDQGQGSYQIEDDLVINGPGADNLTIDAGSEDCDADSDGDMRIFTVDDANSDNEITVEIKDLKLINGDTRDGGAIWNSEDLTVDSVEFENNCAGQRGGAIFNTLAVDSLSVIDSRFLNNKAYEGGAIYNRDSTIKTIEGSTFTNNSARDEGGAIFNDGRIRDGVIEAGIIEEIKNSTFSGNTAVADGGPGGSYHGGAIYNRDGLIKKIQNTNFTGNIASYYGGAINNYNGIIEDLLMSNFTSNEAMEGGAIYNESGDDDDDDAEIILIDNTNFNSNMAADGGGAIYNAYAFIRKIDNAEFNNNSAGNDGIVMMYTLRGHDEDAGGAIYNKNAVINEILNSKFDNNSAGSIIGDDDDDDAGGAIYNYDSSGCCSPYSDITLIGSTVFDASVIGTIAYSTFSNNSAHEGGAIFNGVGGDTDDGDAIIQTIKKSTFNNNLAEHGMAIFNEDFIQAINNCTFDSNDFGFGSICEDNPCFNLCVDDEDCEGNPECLAFCSAICGCGGFGFPRSLRVESNGPPGAYEGYFRSQANISFSTFTRNLIGLSLFGDSDSDSEIGEVNILNNIFSENIFSNCICDNDTNCGGESNIDDFGGNYEDSDECDLNDGFDTPNIVLGPLADNGGPTQTVELVAGAPVDGATTIEEAPDDGCIGFIPGNDTDIINTDQRGANRPNGSRCDSGAYETGLLHSVKITKLTIPTRRN